MVSEKEKLREIVQEYLRKLDQLEKEKDEELCKVTEDDPLLELEIHDKYVELENKLWDEYYDKLEDLLDEVSLEFIDDYNIRLGKKFTNTKVHVYYYNLPKECVVVHELPLISEETTPFTHKVIKYIDWSRIRPIWGLNIHDFIITLAEAEHNNTLDKAIKEIERRLRAGSWIYEYQNMLHALEKAIAETSKQ